MSWPCALCCGAALDAGAGRMQELQDSCALAAPAEKEVQISQGELFAGAEGQMELLPGQSGDQLALSAEERQAAGSKEEILEGGGLQAPDAEATTAAAAAAFGAAEPAAKQPPLPLPLEDAKTSLRAGLLAGSGQRCINLALVGTEVSPGSLLDGFPNKVVTTRFTVLTWLPKSLFFQFQRIANLYFLFIAVVVCFEWSPKGWKSKLFPFLGIIAFTALKDLYEDFKRRQEDNTENSRICWVYDHQMQTFVKTAWRDVKTGALLWTPCDEAFPADLLLLHVCSPHGAFISTVNLDGETNLKARSVPKILDHLKTNASSSSEQNKVESPPELARAIAQDVLAAELEIRLAAPVKELDEMSGSLRLRGVAEASSASVLQFVPRGCVLRNTPWILSVVAYTGDHTKTRLNANRPTGKVSNMQRYLNNCVLGELTCLLVLCIYFASMGEGRDQDHHWIIRCMRYAITIYHVVPISLYVCFEILKLWLGRCIDTDPQMADMERPVGQRHAKACTADLVEELGQIDFLFSDKTGTLTANEMRFARCAAGGLVPGSFIAENDAAGPGITEVVQILATPSHPQHEAMLWLFTCLAVCHSVQPESGVGGDMKYSGPSPDEVALVKAAKDVGVAFVKRASLVGEPGQQVTVVGPRRHPPRNFTIRHELEFTSDRKRMSVICEYAGCMYCITKGADNIMEGLLTAPFSKEQGNTLSVFSKQGLRTLVVASKVIDAEALGHWERDHQIAANALEGRAEKLAESAAKIEKGLEFVGITAVEDRLQDGVPTAIATIKSAGIRVWVLTGDKTETAVDIARSCLLFTEGMELAYITAAESGAQAKDLLEAARKKLSGKPSSGVVLDGQTVKWILEDHDAAVLLYQVGFATSACVCCRLSPAQKRKLVEVVRSCNPLTITLAVGDGANDVPMIQGAHVGVGIRGKEGAQAVMASDIAISQFRFLVPLLMCHGRRAYRRTATYLCYYLYKNVTLAWGDIIWAHFCGFSGDVAYPEWLSSMFNALFTCWPVLIVLGFDKDVPDEIANQHPEIYLEGPRRSRFNYTVFAVWMLCAAYHGSLAWLIPNMMFGSMDYESVNFWRGSASSFTLVIFTISLKLFLVSYSRLQASTLLPLLGSVVTYLCALFYLGEKDGDPMPSKATLKVGNGEAPIPVWAFTDSSSIAVLLLIPLALLAPDWMGLLWRRRLRPSPLHLLRAQVRAGYKEPDKECERADIDRG